MKKTAGANADESDFELDPELQITAPKVRQALDLWNKRRGTRFAPTRADIDARGAKAFLPHLQIFEVIDGGRAYRVKLLGTAIAQAIKEDPTGEVFDETSTRPVVQRTLRAIRWVIANRKPLRTYTRRTAMENREFLAHETLFMPLSDDGEAVQMVAIVGVFTSAARTG